MMSRAIDILGKEILPLTCLVLSVSILTTQPASRSTLTKLSDVANPEARKACFDSRDKRQNLVRIVEKKYLPGEDLPSKFNINRGGKDVFNTAFFNNAPVKSFSVTGQEDLRFNLSS